MATLTAFGHSYATGNGSEALTSTQTIPYLVAQALGYTLDNNGVSGTAAISQPSGPGPDAANGGWPVVWSDVAPDTSAPFNSSLTDVLVLHGINDLGLIAAANVDEVFGAVARSIIDRIRLGGLFQNTDASCAYGGGSWTSTTSAGQSVHQSPASGTVTITVPSTFPGGAIILGALCPSGTTGSFAVTVDGSSSGTLAMPSTTASRTIPVTKRITGLAAGAHTIVLTASASGLLFDWWGIEAADPPRVGWMRPVRLTSTGYSAYSSWASAPTNAKVDTAGATLATIAAEYTDGLVKAFDVESVTAESSGAFMTDGIHPNVTSAASIATAISGAWAWPGGGLPLTIGASSTWSQSGTSITVNDTAVGVRSTVAGTVYSPSGGRLVFGGTHGSRFEASLDGSSWASTVVIPSGVSTVYLGATRQAGDPSLSAKVGVPL